jgi:hypothetical protein
MANTVVRPLGYSGRIESLTWSGLPSNGRAYLWGGGGGGGGKDAATPGGNGSGGGFTEVFFTLFDGDVLQVVVGGPGGSGQSDVAGQGGGSPGASYLTTSTIFNTRTEAASPPTFAQYNPNYCTFLNTYGVWESNTRTQDFDRSYTVAFPSTGLYTFTASADNSAVISMDGTPLFSATTFTNTFEQPVQVTAGPHTIRIQALNTGGPGSVALTISGGDTYSAGRGGNAGGAGTSGGGGGGGGATVLLLNDNVIGVAGGGGGGGGAGNGSQGQPAPGPRGTAPFPITNGQNGTNKNGNGGGGGGGGGGYNGGNGGQSPGGDTGGESGFFGDGYSFSGDVFASTRLLPAGATYPYWNSNRGRGGRGGNTGPAFTTSDGTPGYAVIEIDTVGAFVKDAGVWKPIEAAYIKVNNTWQRIQATYRKTTGGFFFRRGFWQPISDSYSPLFSQLSTKVGINSREATGDAGQGGGGGGCCVVSTAFADQGIWSSQQKHELIAWCEDRLHNRVLGECFRRGYQVVGSKVVLPILKTSWGRNYCKWAFDNGTRMVRGKSFSWWSVPNSLLWITAFMLVGSVVTTRYANRCWKSTGKD